MSVSRKDWSALSTLAQQWTMEDEEEVERERRRKMKSLTSSTDPDDIEPETTSKSSVPEHKASGDGGLEQLQMDFVKMLRMRDECRRRRHVETLSRQRHEKEGGGEGEVGGGEGGVEGDRAGEARVEVLDDDMRMSLQCCMEALGSAPPVSSTDFAHSPVSERNKTNHDNTNFGHDLTTFTPRESSRKYASFLSISFDKNPEIPLPTNRLTSPLSPRSPPFQVLEAKAPLSPTGTFTQSHTYNRDSIEGSQNGSSSSFEPADKAGFTRQSSRTMSFRMLKKKEEETMQLQRSASMRITAKKFEHNKGCNEEEGQQTPFQRHSKQRVSSCSIQEKMERLTQASQKWEAVQSPTRVHKTQFLVDKVSRNREFFEKEQATSEISLARNKEDVCRRDIFLSAGILERINHWKNTS